MAGRLVEEAGACFAAGPLVEADCSGYLNAAENLRTYARKLREGETPSTKNG